MLHGFVVLLIFVCLYLCLFCFVVKYKEMHGLGYTKLTVLNRRTPCGVNL